MDITTLALAKNYTDEQIKQAAIGSGVDLTDYLKKEESYTRQEIDDKVENLDYQNLKNKPFYSEINKYIIPLQEIEFVNGEGEGLPEGTVAAILPLSNIISVATNVLYNFTFDDEITQVKFMNYSGLFAAGNLGIVEMGEDTGEPYIIAFLYDDGDLNSPMLILYVTTTEGKHTIELSYIEDPVPLIPEGIYNFKEDEYGHYCHYWERFCGRLQEGEKYKFTFNNTAYEITLAYEKGNIYESYGYEVYRAGNLYLFNRELEDTGENYCILISYDGIHIFTSTEGDYSVSLEIPQVTEIIHKLDLKYIPDIAFGTLELSKEGTVATINYTDRNGNLQTINIEDGVKPVRGTDYWTEADKAEIKAYVDNAILGGTW